MAINDVLPLKAALRDAIANLKCFWGLGHQRPNFDGYIYAICFLPFGNVWLGSVSVQHARSTMQNLPRVGENSDHILSRLWTKVHEIFRRCRKPLVPSNALFWLSVSSFVQKVFAIKSRSRRKTEQMQKFCGPQFLWEGRFQLFYSTLLGRLTTHYLAKFGWVPFADVRLRSLAMKQNAQFTEGG